MLLILNKGRLTSGYIEGLACAPWILGSTEPITSDSEQTDWQGDQLNEVGMHRHIWGVSELNRRRESPRSAGEVLVPEFPCPMNQH